MRLTEKMPTFSLLDLNLLVTDKPVGALAAPTVINKRLILVLGLIETTFGRQRPADAVTVEHYELI